MMPLQSSGIIVVEKPTPTTAQEATSNLSTTATARVAIANATQQQLTTDAAGTEIHYIDYYGANDVRSQQLQAQQQHVVDGNSARSISCNQAQQQQPIMRRSHQRTNSNSSNSSSSNITTATTIQQVNVKNQQQSAPMHQQPQQAQQQIIQHTNTHQQQQHQQQTQQQQPPTVQLQQQQQQQQHAQQQHQKPPIQAQHQTQQQPQQQVIQVSEEFIEQANASGTMMISTTTGEVLNPQIFKIVATDSATGNMIIDSGSAVGSSQKVLLSNLTVLAKQPVQTAGNASASSSGNLVGATVATQQQQHVSPHPPSPQQAQTINFMSAKNLSYLTTPTSAASSMQSGATVATSGKQQKFSVAGTYKSNTKQQQQQQHQMTTYQQLPTAQQQTQPQQLFQKVTVPRSVQMVTRVQTLMQPATTTTTSMHQLPHQQPQTQMLQLQQKPKYATGVGGNSKGGGNMLKKSGSMKISQSNKMVSNNLQQQQQQGVKTTYITQQQQQLQQPHYQTSSGKVKSKMVKQYNTINNSTGATVVGGTLSMTTLPQQQQLQGTYTINHKSNNNHQPTTTITKLSSSKYVLQQQQQQQLHHVATLPQGTQLHHKSNVQQQSYNSSNNVAGNILLQQQSIGSCGSNNTTSAGVNVAGTIKFVNTHATVIQQHQPQLSMQQQQQQQKLSTTFSHRQQQQQVHFVDAPKDGQSNNNSNIYQLSTATVSQQQQQQPVSNSNGQSLISDDIVIVNGTQMTDELSARILQSMAQKSFSNQQRYQQQQQKVTTANSMPPPTPQQSQQQQQQIVLQHSPVVSGANILLSPKEYPLYSPVPGQQPQSQSLAATTITQYVQQQSGMSATAYLPVSSANAGVSSVNTYAAVPAPLTASGRQVHSAPGSRSHSLERKSHDSTTARKSSEYFKAHNNNSANSNSRLPATTVANNSANIPLEQAQAQVIHLQTLKSPLCGGSYAMTPAPTPTPPNSATNDEDIIGEEVRPAPVNTQDLRLRILHAVQQDHTYANAMPAHLVGSELSGATSQGSGQTMVKSGSVAQSLLQSPLVQGSGGQMPQWSLGGIGATVTSTGQPGLTVSAGGSGVVLPTGVAQSSYTLHGQQIPRLQQDDDAHSAISNGSRVAIGDIDPGEETETAPEAEAEDDSVTRCICDLTHDDGYMICCDKCFAWQHVDCMGIDRQNIPDEYQCELCQPRPVDKARARALQLMKRKEQTQLLMNTQGAQSGGNVTGLNASGFPSGNIVAGNKYLPNDVHVQQRLAGNMNNAAGGNFNASGVGNDAALQALSAAALGCSALHPTTKKGKVLKKAKDTTSAKKSKKAEKLAASGAGNLGGGNGKPPRKETKKNAKRKTKSGDGLGSGATAAEKHAANLRQWIENYELAVTNHYSPELRARLHAITKQPSLLQSILNTENKALKECCNSLENKATTVPHAGGKILISNLDIPPNCPIFELRGKYMLSPQYKMQNASVNMNSPPPSNYLASLKAHKTPGPFIFFYQLPGAEKPTQTRNPDGSYPPLPPQPAYLNGPEICVDTRTYGNEARFVRRSCRPNAEIQHLFEKGTIHLFIVSTTHIRASTEITIKHEPHDLNAVENKKSSNVIVQPTSTACACGLTKDCLFGPPPQNPLPTTNVKSSSRKALTLNGSVVNSSAAMQLTMGGLPASGGLSGKKKSQSINRNRSTSSSGDSNMGLNSPNVNHLNLQTACHNFKNSSLNLLSSHTAVSVTASGPMSAASSVSSAMHDSGICTSSSSPSVSIPSPTSHMHSPTQQQQQQPQQMVPVPLQPLQQQQPLESVQQLQSQPPTLVQHALIMQHNPQHQQILAALPTPMLLSPQQLQQQQQPQQQLNQTAMTVITTTPQLQSNVTKSPLLQEVETEQKQNLQQVQQEATLHVQLPAQRTPDEQQQQQQEQVVQQLQQQQQQQQKLVETTTSDTTLAAAALHSLNASVVSSNSSVPSSVPSTPNTEQGQQQTQFIIAQATLPVTTISENSSANIDQQQQQSDPQPSVQSVKSSTVSSPSKSPQKLTTSTTSTPATCGRKTPAKNPRTTSVSEDTSSDHHSNQHDDCSGGASSSSTLHTSTPKEKPKLSREDRKMEAILRAIEKMERNQQRKQEQSKSKSVSKRRSSNSNSPASPTKRANSSSELDASGGNQFGVAKKNTVASRKKKRKSHKSYSTHGSQRKRRKSRINSNESDGVDNAVTSETESASMLSPPIQTTASVGTGVGITVTAAYQQTSDMSGNAGNVDQAAGLLMALANPNVKVSPQQQQQPQSPQQQQLVGSTLLTSEYTMDELKSPQRPQSGNGDGPGVVASPPPTPPTAVSSACLLIEAAVGPLEQLDSDSGNACGEFKYPKTKTKKGLMSTWLNQVEGMAGISSATVADSNSPHDNQYAGSTMTPNAANMPLGLDTLVQAAMSDYKQPDGFTTESGAAVVSSTVTEEPQNLSMAAKKVEEFIHQTECTNSSMEQHATAQYASFSAEHQQHYNNREMLVDRPTCSVTRNLHLPLQVSSCSNNSSVKKRWLRQAISEETDENSMTPSSTTPSTASPTTNGGNISGAPINNVPNGFTTPLKKRRLIINRKEDEENDVSGSTSPSGNVSESPVIGAIKTESFAMDNVDDVDVVNDNVEEGVSVKNEEVDEFERETEIVDVENEHPQNTAAVETHMSHTSTPTAMDVDVKHEYEPHHEPTVDLEVSRAMEMSGEEMTKEETKQEMILDQDDDVDILRSPSPGQKMVAEDNLVKIEPEDTSGGDDVKIDVEREESLAGDKFDEIMQVKKEEAESEVKSETVSSSETSAGQADVKQQQVEEPKHSVVANKTPNDIDVKLEIKSVFDIKKEEIKIDVKQTSRKTSGLTLLTLDEKVPASSGISSSFSPHSDEPLKKKLKAEPPQTSLLKPLNARMELTSYLAASTLTPTSTSKPTTVIANSTPPPNCMAFLAAAAAAAIERKPPPPPPPSTSLSTSVAINATTTSISTADNGVTTVSAAVTVVSTASVVSTIVSSATTHTPTMINSNSMTDGGTLIPSQLRKHHSERKVLTDDDIQERLHSFHKENILFLQSRNKKSKTSSTSNASMPESKSVKSENKTSTSHHGSKTHLKHSKSLHNSNSSNTSTSASSSHGSGSTGRSNSSSKKLHKKDRSSRNSVGGSGSSSRSSSSSSKLTSSAKKSSSSSYKKDSVSSTGTSSANCNNKLADGKHSATNNIAASSTHSGTRVVSNSSDKEREREKEKEKNRHRSTSSSSTSSTTSTSKKRQLNFEQELTKDMHLVNSITSSRHRKDSARDSRDEKDSGGGNLRKRRESSSSGAREEHRTGNTNSGSRHKQNSSEHKVSDANNTTAIGHMGNKAHPASGFTSTAAATTPVSTATTDNSAAMLPAPTLLIPAASYVHEHSTIPHFNNVLVTPPTNVPPPLFYGNHVEHVHVPPNSTTSTGLAHPMSLATPSAVATTAMHNIPANYGVVPPPPTCGLKTLSMQPVLGSLASAAVQALPPPPPPPPPLPPSAQITTATGAPASPMTLALGVGSIAATTNNITGGYNSIYGKFRDNPPPVPAPSIVPPPLPSSAVSNDDLLTAAGAATTPTNNNISLSEYLDTKVKSYSTLGSYSTLLRLNTSAASGKVNNNNELPAAGLANNTACSNSSVNCNSNLTNFEKSSPTTPPVIGGKMPTPLKMLTKTASHDPRLNPILSAPEPPPAPKRKLSINEYRKRMQLSTDSSGSNSAVSTPTTPDTSMAMTPVSSLASLSSNFAHAYNNLLNSNACDEVLKQTPSVNKCTLNSPERSSGEKSVDIKESKHRQDRQTPEHALDSSNESSLKFNEDDSKKGQFSAAPTLLEKQQEKLCERLKLLRHMKAPLSGGCGEFDVKKESDLFLMRNHSISSDLDNCLEAISSSSTSLASSRESSPERSLCNSQHKKDTNNEGLMHTKQQHSDTITTATAAVAAIAAEHDAATAANLKKPKSCTETA